MRRIKTQLLHLVGHISLLYTTVGTTPLDEFLARRRDLYLTTQNTHNRQTSMPPVGFEPTISVGERPQIYALDRAVTGTGEISIQYDIILSCVARIYELFIAPKLKNTQHPLLSQQIFSSSPWFYPGTVINSNTWPFTFNMTLSRASTVSVRERASKQLSLIKITAPKGVEWRVYRGKLTKLPLNSLAFTRNTLLLPGRQLRSSPTTTEIRLLFLHSLWAIHILLEP